MGGDPIRCMSEKDSSTSSVKDSSDRDLKHNEHLIGRRDARRNIVRDMLVSLQKCKKKKMFIELK